MFSVYTGSNLFIHVFVSVSAQLLFRFTSVVIKPFDYDAETMQDSLQSYTPYVLTHYQTTNFRLFQTEEFADDNFKYEENGRKLSKQVENTVGKGEIARYEQFLLFPQCFQKACFPGASKGVTVWEWV